MNCNQPNSQNSGSTEAPAISIPGIDDAVLAAAGIRHCRHPECAQLTGSLHEGLLIPYVDIHGNPVMDEGGPYCRLRLDQDRGEQKYHQRAGTRTHAYITPGFAQLAASWRSFVVIEGEKKSLAMRSAGIPAIGTSGFYGLFDGQNGFTDEFVQCLEAANPESIIFMGDTDVVFNPQFADAVAKLAMTLPKTHWADLQVIVCCVPPDAPGKGVDDVRAALGGEFSAWLQALRQKMVPVSSDMMKGRIALQLLEVHRESLEKLARSNEQKDLIFRGLAKLAAGLADDLAEQEIRELANSLGFAKRPFGQAVTKAKRQLRSQAEAVPEGAGVRIDLARQSGEWTIDVLRAMSNRVYQNSERDVTRLLGGELVPFKASQLIPFLDHPDKCIFITGAEGQPDRAAKFKEEHAKQVLGAAVDHPELLRMVRLHSTSPVLLDDGHGGCELITSYSADHQILVSGAGGEHPIPDFQQAWRYIEGLLADFCFASDTDRAAFLALIFSPALAQGKFLGQRRVPFFVVSKDQMGAGGGTACQAVSRIYNQQPRAITVSSPAQAKESISRPLLAGASIIYLDNVRGSVLSDLPFLESLLTEPIFDGRKIYVHEDIDVTHLTLMATSNGLILSRDLADRVVEIRIRKQPSTHFFTKWEEGDFLSHIERWQPFYLACVHTIIRAWVEAERPEVKSVSGIRFKEWERAIGGILEMRPAGPLDIFPEGGAGAPENVGQDVVTRLRQDRGTVS